MRIEGFLSRLALLSIAVMASFAVGEVMARIYLTRLADEETFKTYASIEQLTERHQDRKRYSLHRYLGYVPTPDFEVDGRKEHSSLGFRGREVELPKPEGEFRIVCLGGSTTYTLSPSYEGSYPELLERQLRQEGHPVRVVNAGAHGYSSFETLINFEFRVLDLEPDLIIVYHGVNDVSARLVFPPLAYRGDNSGMRGPRPSRYRSPLEYSTLLRMLLIRAGRMESPNEVEFRRMSIGGQPESTHRERTFMQQKRRGSYPSGLFEKLPVAKLLQHNAPRYFERNMRNLLALAKANDVTAVVATFAYLPEFPENLRASAPEYTRAMDEQNEILRELVPRAGGHLFDFARVFPAKSQLFLDGEHVNERGASLKARLFAHYLITQGLLPAAGKAAD